MRPFPLRCVCGGRVLALLGVLLLATGCATTPPVAATIPAPAAPLQDDDDFSELIVQLSADLSRVNGRIARAPASTPPAATKGERDRQLSSRARELFSRLDGTTLQMPVVGIRHTQLSDSWGNPRDGGKRKHRGIDIFAPKGTGIVAVADGIITFIGEQPKGGRCLWLTTEQGNSYYYAHLDRWAAGLYEGMEVRAGDLLGYVGNTGNAKTTPPHLHFGINQNDSMVNPYPILTRATLVSRARVATEAGGGALGTR